MLEVTWTVIPAADRRLHFLRRLLGLHADADRSAEFVRDPGQSPEVELVLYLSQRVRIDSDLHVPVDEPVKLIMSSEDVIHSLFIPAFRVKMDCVPGRYTYAWLRGTKRAGRPYDLYCTEYCGDSHYDMQANVVVHKSGEFDAWLENAANYLQGSATGRGGRDRLYAAAATSAIPIDGTAKTGPTFKGSLAQTTRLRDGSSVEGG